MLGAAQASRQTDYYLIYHLTLPPCARPRGERGLRAAISQRSVEPPHRPLLLLLPSLPLQNQPTRPFRHEDALLAPHKPSQLQEHVPTARAISGSRAARGHRPLPTAMAPALAQPDPQNGCSLHSLLKFILNAVPRDHF